MLRPEYPFINQILHTDLFSLCKSLPSQSVDMILCDLPYGTTACAWDEIIPLEPMWVEFKRVIKVRGAIVLTASQPFTSKLVMSNLDWFKYEWVWNKNNSAGFALAIYRPFIITESILVFGNGATAYYPILEERGKPRKKGGYSESENYGISPSTSYNSIYYPKNILNFTNADHTEFIHPTQKPVALFEYLIRTYTLENEIVFDPCVGSGTTALAAMKTNRRYICGDITEEYVNIARQRVMNADPYQPSIKAEGVIQHSLFAGVGV